VARGFRRRTARVLRAKRRLDLRRRHVRRHAPRRYRPSPATLLLRRVVRLGDGWCRGAAQLVLPLPSRSRGLDDTPAQRAVRVPVALRLSLALKSR
jgi:hypothetical protein